MALPDPQLGLVISYAYLWHREYRAGWDSGRKDRPCVIVLAMRKSSDGGLLVRVAPMTHAAPDDPSVAFEIPLPVKHHLALDAERSWIMLDEINEFVWPGFDLRPIPGAHDRFAYGHLPPILFRQMLERIRAVWQGGRGRLTPRD